MLAMAQMTPTSKGAPAICPVAHAKAFGPVPDGSMNPCRHHGYRNGNAEFQPIQKSDFHVQAALNQACRNGIGGAGDQSAEAADRGGKGRAHNHRALRLAPCLLAAEAAA